ncbi:probable inactive ATP-dependent zinc metalloprotease FTSHI 5, chloroplastic isoform X1 [Ziziphus jujuba]|uniref:Probable inactive ATP-dependent zinc metalloprotease FTSHI 5, chloroplastic isoform X1 n=1 Tax=Ziziphus jujuba TaxID=326968 RepID=A0A6P3ZKH3_ZIZJJ|nr:probable inactive ATP-dependent zinc metalloprotease FTSHI 5, chloroplastic isoform X1 [Ziziphus jujuba]
MDAIAASRLLPSPFAPHFSPPTLRNSYLASNHRIRIQIFASKSPKFHRIFFPVRYGFGAFSSLEAHRNSRRYEQVVEDDEQVNTVGNCSEPEGNLLRFIAKQALLTLFFLAIGFAPLRAVRVSALAAPVATEEVLNKKQNGKGKEMSSKSHEYSECTRRLLETVSALTRRVEEVRKGNADLKQVEMELKAVKGQKEELQAEIMDSLYSELKELKRERGLLVKRSEGIVDRVVKTKKEYDKVLGDAGEKEDMDKVQMLEERLKELEEDYNSIWERVGEIEDQILRRETMALSFGVRELRFIERECEQLVENFSRQWRRKGLDSTPKPSVTKLSKSEIQKDLESTQRKYLEQMILPSVLEVDDLGPFFDKDSVDFAQRIKQGLKDSREMQINLEARINKKMKKYGDEKRFVVNTPEDEVVKGFPEIELKWMFGDKEVVVPKAISLHLYHGWKKWREEAKADLKRNLLENVDFGKQYVAQRQERILMERDRLMSKVWFSEDKNRWEMDPMAVPFAVSKKLIQQARIRHDWAVMYVTLKGDDKDYYVDIKELDMLFEDFGGFDGLYMKMLACGIPTAVHLMWIPFSELDLYQQSLLILRLSSQSLKALWQSKIVSYARNWVFEKFKNINDDIMMMIVFPLVEIIIPYRLRLQLGMAWPEEIYQAVGSTWYLKWQSEAEMSFKSRKSEGLRWFLWFLIRSFIYGYILFHVFRFMKRRIPRLLGFGPLRRDPNLRKLRRMKYYLNYRVKRIKRKKKAGIDPITRAFERMKRVKNPPIPLKEFASVESMREEINEVVTFLHNPRAFQEMGARAPRGVLIVGERGTGKTSLALAIAAEAKVPVVQVKAQELEAGLWVGQSASNIRELFQTARDLAPVIIFVEDFDLFAGVRGKYIHTKKQDHEAFINQLLVELDGFEKQDGVVLMATARNLKQIDEALQRPGRMDRVFHLQRPTQVERENILRMSAKATMDNDLIDFVDWKKVAEKTALLRPTELKLVPVALEGAAFRSKFLDTDELMSYCGWFATFSGVIPKWVRRTNIAKKLSSIVVNHLGLTLTKEDLNNVVDLMEPYGQISNGIELLNPPLDWTRETKFPHAVWAAGRGLIALLLPNFDVVDNLWLEPLSWQGIGCSKITKAKNEGSMNGNSESRSYLEKKLVFCFGSHIASQMLLPFGEENYLSSSELKQAQEIATRMVIQYGWGPDDSPAIYYHSNAITALSMGNNHEYEIASKVEKIYDLAYCKAKEMLLKNRQVLEKIVEELLEFEILTGKDLERILIDNGGIGEKEPFFLSRIHEKEPLSSSFLETGNASGATLLSEAAST